jgi:hypothetical protein
MLSVAGESGQAFHACSTELLAHLRGGDDAAGMHPRDSESQAAAQLAVTVHYQH